MQIMIDIPESVYNDCKAYYETHDYMATMISMIANGIPLPKGHGSLIDADAVLEEVHRCLEERDYTLGTLYDNLCELPTIIEADKGEEE